MIDWFELRCLQIVATLCHLCWPWLSITLLSMFLPRCSAKVFSHWKCEVSKFSITISYVWHDVPTLWQTFSPLTTTVGLAYTHPKILYGTLTKIYARVVFVVEWLVGWFLFLLFSQGEGVIIWSAEPPPPEHQSSRSEASAAGMLGRWW